MAYQTRKYILDIGNYALKLITIDTSRRSPCVLGMHTVPIKFDLFPQMAHKPRQERIIAAIEQLFGREPKDVRKHVSVILPNNMIFTRFVNLPNIQRSKLSQIIKFEVEQQIPFIIDEVTWGYEVLSLPQTYDLTVLITAIRNTEINALMDTFDRLHVHVDTFSISLIAYANVLKYLKLAEKNTLLVDFGDEVTQLVLIAQDKIWGRNLLVGGSQLTQELAAALNVDYKTTEKLKRAIDLSTPDAAAAQLSEPARNARDIARRYFDTLLGEISRSVSFFFSLSKEMKVQKILLTGGGAVQTGLLAVMNERFGVPTALLDGRSSVSVALAHKEKFAHEHHLAYASLGLSVQEMIKDPHRIELLPARIQSQRAFEALKAKLAAGSFVFLGLVAIVSLLIFSLNVRYMQAIADIKNKVEFFTQCLSHEQQVTASLAQYQSRFKTTIAVLDRRQIVLNAFDVIATHLPDSLWLTSFSYTKNGTLTLTGLSRGTLADIDYFQKALDLEALFSNVTIQEATIAQDKTETAYRSFALSMTVGETT